jgi:acetolactate synthase small subunit
MKPMYGKINPDKLKQLAAIKAKETGQGMVDNLNPMVAYRKKVAALKKQQAKLNECMTVARKIKDPVKRQEYLISVQAEATKCHQAASSILTDSQTVLKGDAKSRAELEQLVGSIAANSNSIITSANSLGIRKR